MKTVQITLDIGQNDLERKMKQAQGFLAKRIPVRVSLSLHGRQKGHPERGVAFLTELQSKWIAEFGKCVKPATEKNLTLTVMPK